MGYVHGEINMNNELGQFSAARQQLLIQIIAENNFAQVEMFCVSRARTHARHTHDGRKATIYKKNLVR